MDKIKFLLIELYFPVEQKLLKIKKTNTLSFSFFLACSAYFKAMFTGELAESRQTEIIIHDIDEFAMELLIEFCYTSRIIVDEKNVQMLLPAACILQVIENFLN